MKNVKKWLCVLAALALAFVLLPVQETKADYKAGDTCPFCGQGTLILDRLSNTSIDHFFYCSNSECLYAYNFPMQCRFEESENRARNRAYNCG